MEQIAQRLIALREQLEEVKAAYSASRAEMFNALTNANQETIEVNGYRISRAKPHTMKTYSRESVAAGLQAVLDLPEDVILDVLVASQNEADVFGDVVVRRVKPLD